MSAKPVLLLVGEEQEYRPLIDALSDTIAVCLSDPTSALEQPFEAALIDAAFSRDLPLALHERNPRASLYLCGHTDQADDCITDVFTKPADIEAIARRIQQNLSTAAVEALNPLELIDSLPGGVCVFDLTEERPQIAYFNDAVRSLSGYPFEEYSDILRTDYRKLIFPDDRHLLVDLIATYRQEPRMLSESFRLCRKDGSVCWLKVTCSPMPDASGRLLCNAVFIDVTHDKENESRTEQMLAELKYRTERDALTGVYNRETFYNRTRELLEAHPEESFIILAMDIERFKVVNDLFGKDMGDRILRAIGTSLRRLLRQIGTCGRLEADHFAACFPARYLDMESILTMYEALLREQSIDYHIDMSFGIYRIHNMDVPINKMCDRATMALKTVKGNIVRHYAYYDEVLRRDLLEEQSILDEMNTALESGQFVPYIQPIFSVESRQPVSAEALVRWRHPTKGLISPAKFIPLFERNGFITQLDRSVWQQVVKLLAKWREQGIVLPISINISRIDLYHPHLCDDLLTLIQQNGVEPSQLRLEITESAYSDDPDELLRVIAKLRSAGFQILMDDFGSGYSSLNVLMDMPVDILKIDMRFLAELDSNPRAASILTSVMRMAKWLSIPVVAEGVETENQLSFLRSIGCDSAQGFLLGKPVPVDEFERLLRNEPLCAAAGIDNSVDLSVVWNSSVETNLMFNGMVGGMALYELVGDVLEIRRVNDGYYELFGCTPKQVFCDSPNKLVHVHEDDLSTVLATLQTASETGRVECARFRRRHGDGHTIWLEARARYLGVVGQNKVFYCTFNDITAQRELEQSVELNRYLDVLKTAYSAILELNNTDHTLKPVYNDERIKLPPPDDTGLYTREELAQLVHPDDIRAFLRTFDKGFLAGMIAENGSYQSELRLLGEKGDYAWTSLTILHLHPQSALYLVCFSDIDARKRNDALSEQNRMLRLKQDELMRYQALMEQTGSSMIEWNMDTEELISSKGYASYAISRYPLRELWNGQHIPDAFESDDSDMFRQFKESLVKHGHASMTVRMRQRESDPIWCRLVCSIIRGRHAARLIAAITRVDELIKTRESYIDSQMQLQAFSDSFMVGLGVFDFEGDVLRLLYLSGGYLKMCGFSETEEQRFIDDPLYNVHPDELDRMRRHIDAIRQTGEPFTVEYRAFHADGHTMYLRSQTRMVSARENTPPRLLCVITDITEQKALQNHLQALLDEIPAGLGIYELTNPPKAKYVNRRMAEIFGYTYHELCERDKQLGTGLLQMNADKLQAAREKARKGAFTTDDFYRTRTKDGSPIWVRARSSIIERSPGVVTSYSLLIDETREHDAELKLHWQEEGYRLLAEHTAATTFDYDVEADVMCLMFHPLGEPQYQLVIREHLANLDHTAILKPEFIEPYRLQLTAALSSAVEMTYEFLGDFDRQGYRWFRAYFISVADESNVIYRVTGRLLDITNERTAEESLLMEQNYRKALLTETLYTFDIDYRAKTATLLHHSDDAERRFFPVRMYYADTPERATLYDPDEYAAIRPFFSWRALQELVEQRTEVKRQFRILDREHRRVWIETTFSPLEGTSRALVYIKVIDSERKRMEELQLRAELDPVSGVLNRCTMQDRIELALKDHPDDMHAFLLMDIDGFKQINDTYGHAMGDTVIHSIAQTIRGVFSSVLGRLGGDEFAALLTSVRDIDSVRAKAAEVIRAVDALRFAEPAIRLTLSIGIAIAPTDGATFDALYHSADAALYRAKAQGKHQYCMRQDETP